jgi:hypothetical protein
MRTHLFVAWCIALIASAPLTYPGPLQTHVGFAPLYALLEQRFASAELGVLPALLGALLTRIGLSPLTTLKTLDAFAFVLGASGMFLWVRQWHGDAAGLVAAALYSLLPYRLMTTYIRGTTSEALFWGLLPCVLWVVVALTMRTQKRTGTTKKKLLTFVSLCLWVVLGVVLWKLCAPVSNETPQPVYLFQLFSASWNYGSRGDWLDATSLQLGLASVGLSLIALWLRPERRAFIIAASAVVCALLSIAPFSAWWPWEWLLNAPWQFIGLAGFLLCWLGGSVANLIDSDDVSRPATEALSIIAALLTFTVLASYSYLTPRGLDYEPTTPPLARFGNEAYLVSATITPTIAPNTTFTVTLLWQGLRPFADDYKVFVHIVDAQEKILLQRDAIPLNGVRPTRTWQRGELLRDTYTFTLPATAPHAVRMTVGLYHAVNGARLKTSDNSERVVIGN